MPTNEDDYFALNLTREVGSIYSWASAQPIFQSGLLVSSLGSPREPTLHTLHPGLNQLIGSDKGQVG